MAKKKDLGKGLRALLKDVDKSTGKPAKRVVKELAKGTKEISISSIETNPFQPRKEFDQVQLEELSSSIKLHGLVQPITVRSLGDGKFQLISGERRLRASKLAKLKTIPAYIRLADDQEMLEFALIENIQRQNLNALEVAFSYQRLMDECSLTQDELSKRVGKKRSTVANYVRLLKLPPQIQQAVKKEEISMGHARVLVGINNIVRQLDLFNKTRIGNWSVRKLEEEASAKRKRSSKTTVEHPEVSRFRNNLSKNLGVKVNIKRSEKGKGSITIPFQSDEELNDIIEELMK